jgi:hypothetical protein
MYLAEDLEIVVLCNAMVKKKPRGVWQLPDVDTDREGSAPNP